MNQRAKAELRNIIASLTALYEKELQAAKRHSKSQPVYAEHASFAAEQIQAAIELLKIDEPASAIKVLESVVASLPGQVFAGYERLATPARCRGACNHPEHQ